MDKRLWRLLQPSGCINLHSIFWPASENNTRAKPLTCCAAMPQWPHLQTPTRAADTPDLDPKPRSNRSALSALGQTKRALT